MFASKVAELQTKAAQGVTGRLVPRRSALVGHLTQQRAPYLIRNGGGDHEQDGAHENMRAREAPHATLWDFSKIPLYPPDDASQPQLLCPLTTPPIPGAIQAKFRIGQVNDPLEYEADRVADRAMRMPDPALSLISGRPQTNRTCAACEVEEKTQRLFEGRPKVGEKTKPEKKKSEPERVPSREPCDKKCGTGGPWGNTECELDTKSGLLTGRVTKEVFDKNPCTLPCVEIHEGVHARKIAPNCAATKKCLDNAGGDYKKQDNLTVS
jgi:hypothetical protein